MAIKKRKVSQMPLVGDITKFEVLGVDSATNSSARANMSQLRGNVGPTPRLTFAYEAVSLPSGLTLTSTTLGTVAATANSSSAAREGRIEVSIVSNGSTAAQLGTTVRRAAASKIVIPVYVYRACCNDTALVSRPLHALGNGTGHIYVNGKQYGDAMTFDMYGRFGPINIEVNKGDKVRVTLPSFLVLSVLWSQAQTSEYTITGNETQLVFVPHHRTNAQGANAASGEIALERVPAIEPSPDRKSVV